MLGEDAIFRQELIEKYLEKVMKTKKAGGVLKSTAEELAVKKVIGANVERAVKESGLPVGEVEKRLHISRGYLSKIFSGQHIESLRLLVKIATITGWPLKRFFETEEERQEEVREKQALEYLVDKYVMKKQGGKS